MEQETNGTELEESIITDEFSNETTPNEKENDNEEFDQDLFDKMSFLEKIDYQNRFKKTEDTEDDEEEKPKESKETPKKESKELAPKETKEPSKPENLQSLKVKINGVEQEVKVEELLKTYQKSQGADQKFYEASQMKKQAEEVINILKNRPFEVLEKLGLDIDELAEQRLLQKLQYEQMTDEEKELYESKEKLKHYETQERIRREQEEFHKLNQLKQLHIENYTKQIQDVIEKNDLPRDSHTVKKFLNYMGQAISNKINVTVSDLVELVKEDLATEERQFLDRYKKRDISKLIEELGDDTVKAIQKEHIKKLKNPYVTNVNPVTKTVTKGKSKPTLEDWKKTIEKHIYS